MSEGGDATERFFVGVSFVTSLVGMTHVNKAPQWIRRGAGFQSLQLARYVDDVSRAFFRLRPSYS